MNEALPRNNNTAFIPIESVTAIRRKTLVFDAEDSPVPYITFGVTDSCNIKCSYCSPTAENHGFEHETAMPVEEMLDTARSFYQNGVKIFRVTGGEPTLWPYIDTMISGLQDIGEDVWVNLNSNAISRRDLMPLLEKYGERMTLRVSIDSVDPNKKIQKRLTPFVKDTLLMAKELVPVRINTVVTTETLPQVPKIIDTCKEMGIDLKLLDMYYNRDFYSGEDTIPYWKSQFVPILATIGPMLEEKGFKFSEAYDNGGYGIPLPVYTDGDINISVKDSTLGTYEHDICHGCSAYPCQEGLYSPMISHGGTLHVSECRYEPFMSELKGRTFEEKNVAVQSILNQFAERRRREEPATLVREFMENFSNGSQ